jgi:hypothetical protein
MNQLSEFFGLTAISITRPEVKAGPTILKFIPPKVEDSNNGVVGALLSFFCPTTGEKMLNAINEMYKCFFIFSI